MKFWSKPHALVMLTMLLLINVGIFKSYADQAKEDIPKEAVCTVCASHGTHAEAKPEPVKAWSRYMGEMYYFCNEGCKVKFDATPDAFMPPTLPRPLPVFTLENLKGKDATLEIYKGKVVLLDFWATWCLPCVEAIPDLKKLHKELRKDDKFTVIGISVDVGKNANKKVKKFIKKQKISYPILRDAKKGEASLALNVTAIPAMFLVDPEGQIVAQWAGRIDHEVVKETVEELLNQGE